MELIDIKNLRAAVLKLRALDHKAVRQPLLELLEENGEMTVTEMFIALRLEQCVVSQHLARLRQAGLVTTERIGKNVYYSINKPEMWRVSKLIEQLAENTLYHRSGRTAVSFKTPKDKSL